jgi:hypothetical protein
VATHLSARLALPGDPADAFALVTDPAYVERVATATGGHDVEVTVTPAEGAEEGATTVSARTMPANLPSYAKAFVGDTIRLVETRVFGPSAADGSRAGTFSVDFGSTPISIRGTLRLAADGSASAMAIEIEITASVPFVGGKVERIAAEWIERFVAKEEKVAAGQVT